MKIRWNFDLWPSPEWLFLHRMRGSTPSSHVFFNIHGLISSSHDPFTINELQNHSIVFISETWLHSTQTPYLHQSLLSPFLQSNPPEEVVLVAASIYTTTPSSIADWIHPIRTTSPFPSTTSLSLVFTSNPIQISMKSLSHLRPRWRIFQHPLPSSSGEISMSILIRLSFSKFADFLFHQGISLISRTDQPTFSYSKGSSCVDYIFSF